MNNIICKIVGHQPPVYNEGGWYSPGEEYATLSIGARDGVGRMHARVIADCARCGKEFTVARVHVPTIEVEVEKKNEQN